MIRIVRAVVKKESQDIDLALLVLRTTPIGSQLPSPAELIFGRQVTCNLPIQAKSPNHEGLLEHREQCYKQMTEKFHHSHPELSIDQPVYSRTKPKNTGVQESSSDMVLNLDRILCYVNKREIS